MRKRYFNDLVPQGLSATECWNWLGWKHKTGYGGFRRHDYAHRVAYEKAYGPIPESYFVCHKCDNPSCVNPKHLWLGTPKDNMLDKMAKGRQNTPSRTGERNSRARLTEQTVLRMRSGEISGSASTIAREYGVSKSAVKMARSGRTWRHLNGSV